MAEPAALPADLPAGRPAAGGAGGPVVPPGSVAVVTGASRGLGAGLAASFAAAGLSLGLCARELPAPVGDAPVVRQSLDVADAEELERFADDVVARFGRIDLWVNNAGVLEPTGPLVEARPEELRRHVDTNVLGVLHGTGVFARHVRSRAGGGVLVNVSSGAATRPYEGWAAYCAAKAAVAMATEVVALEEARHGLWAYAVAPGVVDTDMQAAVRATPEDQFPAVRRFLDAHREGRFNSPSWVARFLLELAFGDPRPDAVALRVPEEPVAG